MAPTSQTLNFDALVSTTLKNYTPRIEDNIFSNITLLYWLKEAGHIEKVSGGEQIVEPLLYGKNATTGSYAGYDNIPTTPTDGITAAIYDWKQFAVSIAISGLEEAKNNGEAAVISLLKAKIDQAEMSAQDAMNKMFYLDGSGNGGKDWNGLANIVTTDGSGTVGAINSATDTWWANQYATASTAAAGLSLGTAKPLAIKDISTLYNNCSKGTIRPEFLLGSQGVWEQYEQVLQPQLRFQSTKVADAGFENLLYKSAPVMWDQELKGTGKLYFLNSKFLKLKVHSDVWFKATPFEKPHGQDARFSQILSYGNLVTNNRRFQGVLSGITKAENNSSTLA
jgi:hypothetical protein